ncbi:hypothetical protein SynRS9915_00162 [Synechococcus sp. RS9915]|nr:hypothetical protein SynRS9915_00162 [Synechococcus sp. RS9915]
MENGKQRAGVGKLKSKAVTTSYSEKMDMMMTTFCFLGNFSSMEA